MSTNTSDDSTLVISYLALRRAIGIVGLAFPVMLLVGGAWVFHEELPGSISDYYHTGMVAVFAGTLCAIGFFLFSYNGYGPADYRAGRLGCLFAVGVALFPTNPPGYDFNWVAAVHFLCAFGFFATLIYFSLALFTRRDRKREPTKQKLLRDKVYRACGYVMLACIVLIGFYYVALDGDDPPFKEYAPVFWLEAIAIWAFGISWLVKGEAILKDNA